MSEHREHQQPPTLTVITPYCEDCRGGPPLTAPATKFRFDLTKKRERTEEPEPRPYTSPVYSYQTNTRATTIDKPPPRDALRVVPEGEAFPALFGFVVCGLAVLVWRKLKGAVKREHYHAGPD